MNEDLTTLYFVRTASGKAHLLPLMYVKGMIGDVPRTLCSSLIQKCSEPELLDRNDLEDMNVCKTCLRVSKSPIFGGKP